MKYKIDKYLDTTGLLCPEPVMLLHKAMREIAAGEIIEMTASDPSTTRDVPKFCHFLKHDLLEQSERDKTYVYYLRKKSD
jgi:tRNA 2-thiouridine synthesizing protein A